MSIYSLCKKVTVGVVLISVVTILFTINSRNFSLLRRTEPVLHASTITSDVMQLITNNNNLFAITTTEMPKSESPSKYILNTVGCKIPRTPIMPEYFKKRWYTEKIPDCGYEKLLSELDDSDQKLYLFPAFSNQSCVLYEVSRIPKQDAAYEFSSSTQFKDVMDVKDKEMLVTKCKDNLNFEANIPLKPAVQQKINFWKDVPTENIPTNVLFFGIDSVSRSHAYRSLPKFMDLMKEMGFIDFPGYHSVAASTLSNFMAFLMGLPRKQVRNKCAPDWKSAFDPCPFIWKEFGLSNYVTMYLEDGEQTFNWGGQSGFDYEPTDYYIHALFIAMRDLRLKLSQIEKRDPEKRIQCSSSETVPEFVLRYTKRFIQKFQKTPFFAFTWFAYPFHDHIYSVGNLDNHLVQFFHWLKSLPKFLEKTLIVFVSDHGDRTKFFESKTIDAFIERGLPPLFIRIPENLKKSNPELDLENLLVQNAKELISPFDLHHTFLHILALNGLNSSKSKSNNSSIDNFANSAKAFAPVLADRRSILVPFGSDSDSGRNCENLNIEVGNCVCDTAADVEPIKNPFYLTRIIQYVANQLNRIVQTSKYRNVCAKWTTKVDWMTTQILHKTAQYTDTRIQFSANPGSAHFEVKVRVIHENTNYDNCKLISEFSRTNFYGNQSYCVKFETDADKEMKQFCMCKSMVKDKKS